MVKDKIKGGYGDNKPDSMFDKKQLEKGIKVEMEHTNDKRIATEIAKDHLSEFQDYYKELEKMENKLKTKEIISFNNDGTLNYVDKRYLIKRKDYGYHIIDNGLIHYFDNNKEYERSKFL